MALVEAKNLTKSFGRQKVFKDLNFSMQEHEFIALLGPSGCGKSTLLRLIAGLESPTTGELQLSEDVKHHLSFVFQDSTLLPWRNAYKNIRLPLELRQTLKPQDEELVQSCIRNVGLEGAEKKFPFQLSGGMKMRAALARSLVVRPRLLLMDEPFAALDEVSRYRLQESTRATFDQQPDLSVLFVTHSVMEAVFLSDRILIFNQVGDLVNQAQVQFRNRDASLRTDPKFFHSLQKIQDLFRTISEREHA